MQITKINYGVTKNIGNYESIRLDMEARVNEGESPEYVLQELVKKVDKDAQGLATIRKSGGR